MNKFGKSLKRNFGKAKKTTSHAYSGVMKQPSKLVDSIGNNLQGVSQKLVLPLTIIGVLIIGAIVVQQLR